VAELTTKEKLQPSLLDRLTDDAPDQKLESRDQRVISPRKLREFVLRDLAWLMNSGCLATADERIEQYPLIAESVLNFGLPSLAGCYASSIKVAELEKAVRKAILDFEPRILAKSLEVRARAEEGRMALNALTFEIEGELWAQPVPERLLVRTEIDLETGHVSVIEEPAGGA
jgi:type VI secretion system protein ImpF